MPSNVGTQTVTLKFFDPLDSHVLNARQKDIVPAGIYSGGLITMTTGAGVSVGPLSCEITDGTYQVRVSTADAVTLTLSSTNVYVVLRWVYTGSAANDYMALLATSLPDTNDLVVGRGIFSGATLTSITYAERSVPVDWSHAFRVIPNVPASASVIVLPGVAHALTGPLAVSFQPLSLAAFTAGDTVYVYLTATGGVAASKTAGDYLGKPTLAKVVVPGDGTIEAADITDMRTFLTQPCVPDDLTVRLNTTTGKLEKIQDYLIAMSTSIQCQAVTTYTKVTFPTIVKQSGVTISSSVFTLSAGKMYDIVFTLVADDLNTAKSVEARMRVLTGDTSWGYDTSSSNPSYVEEKWYLTVAVTLGGITLNFVQHITTLVGHARIKPSVDTTAQIEVITQSGWNTDNQGKLSRAVLEITTL
jgi:hypothetical protein